MTGDAERRYTACFKSLAEISLVGQERMPLPFGSSNLLRCIRLSLFKG